MAVATVEEPGTAPLIGHSLDGRDQALGDRNVPVLAALRQRHDALALAPTDVELSELHVNVAALEPDDLPHAKAGLAAQQHQGELLGAYRRGAGDELLEGLGRVERELEVLRVESADPAGKGAQHAPLDGDAQHAGENSEHVVARGHRALGEVRFELLHVRGGDRVESPMPEARQHVDAQDALFAQDPARLVTVRSRVLVDPTRGELSECRDVRPGRLLALDGFEREEELPRVELSGQTDGVTGEFFAGADAADCHGRGPITRSVE